MSGTFVSPGMRDNYDGVQLLGNPPPRGHLCGHGRGTWGSLIIEVIEYEYLGRGGWLNGISHCYSVIQTTEDQLAY